MDYLTEALTDPNSHTPLRDLVGYVNDHITSF